MLFDKGHLIYMIISTIAIVGVLFLANKYIKEDKSKTRFIKIIGWLTLIIHISYLWVDYFKNGSAVVDSSVLLLVYPCNIIMWLLIIAGYLPKDNKYSKMLFEFIFYAGTICAIFGIALNQNYANNPDLSNWSILKGLLSHSVMLIGTIYMLVGGFIKVRVTNCISMLFGIALFIIIGLFMNWICVVNDLENPNSMYLHEVPYESMPFVNTFTVGLVAFILVFIITEVYELLMLEKEDRTLSKILKRGNKNV